MILVPASFTNGKAKHCVPAAHCDKASLPPEHCANCPPTQSEVLSVQGDEAVSAANCALSFCASNPFWRVKEARLILLEESEPIPLLESLPESCPPLGELPESLPTGPDGLESPPPGPDELESPPTGPDELESPPDGLNVFWLTLVVVPFSSTLEVVPFSSTPVIPFSLLPESPLSLPSSRRSNDSSSSSPDSVGSGSATGKLTDGSNVGDTEAVSTGVLMLMGVLMLEKGATDVGAKVTVSGGLDSSLVNGSLSETLES